MAVDVPPRAAGIRKLNSPDNAPLDVLIVGAGPTGLTLAAGLVRFGSNFRVVDRAMDRAGESRALGVQARTLEVLQSCGLGEALVRRGNPSVRLLLHLARRRTAEVRLGDFGPTDTRFPFILFVSQAETEAVLGDYLASVGVRIERGVELVDATAGPDEVHCVLRDRAGREELVRTGYLVGCDGAHSTVRKLAAIPFEGDAYLQDFVLGDVEVDGPLEPDTLHSFAVGRGVALFFPLGSPATWRVIAMPGTGARGRGARVRDSTASDGLPDVPMTNELSLDELQRIVDGATEGGLVLRDPVWLTHFRLHHRQAAHYRAGRIFLAGDAAHIHSPVGAQGMNTGIQDAWNLAWKLALVARGTAIEPLLDSYEAERWPVGRLLLHYTDRAFGLFTRAISGGALAAWVRRTVGTHVLPRLLASKRLRARVFYFVSQLRIRYRKSPAVAEGEPRLRTGPKAGDRLPDAPVTRDGRPTYLQQELSSPHLHLLLCGTPEGWDRARLAELTELHAGLLMVHGLSASDTPGGLVDPHGAALFRLGVRNIHHAAQYLVRPDGHIAFRCTGRDSAAVAEYLDRWFRNREAR
ncbi:MAG TPA: FAD-dependent monooxygenase [Gemmatimonadales bacterium]|nr:FAD-dependent monooxygenase [Gemmatimonadales bacterium]